MFKRFRRRRNRRPSHPGEPQMTFYDCYIPGCGLPAEPVRQVLTWSDDQGLETHYVLQCVVHGVYSVQFSRIKEQQQYG